MEVRAHNVSRRTRCCTRAFIGLALLAGGCSLSGPDRNGAGDPSVTPPDQPSGGAEVATGSLRVGRETRLDSLIDRVQLAFRGGGGVFVAGHSTHAVSVDRGVVQVTPYQPGDGDQAVSGAPIALETTSIRRGDALVDTTYRSAAVDRDTGRLLVTRAQVVEELRNDERGVEQSWRFESAPGSGGDLVVEVAVVGPRYLSATAGGLHFGAPGRLGFRYSRATWIDANGVDVPITTEYADGAIRMVIPEDVLSGTAFPAVLDPTVEAEVGLDQPVVGWTGAGARRSSVAASADGDQFLVVWQDDRNGSQRDIFGTRIGAAGEVLDTLGIAVSDDNGVQDNPTVAFAGGVFVVAWQEAGNIRAARVDPADGAVTQLGNVAATGASETLPHLASRGSTALLVYQSDEDVRGALFNGTTFGGTINIATSAAAEREPAVAADPGGNFLVTFTQGATTAAPDLRGRLVTAGGVPSGAAFDVSAASGSQSQSAVAFSAGNFAVVWANNNNGIDVYGARVSPAGAVLDTRTEGAATVGGIAVSAALSTQNQPEIACSGASCLVAWADRRNLATRGFDVFGQVVSADLTASGGEMLVAGAIRDQRAPSVTASASGWMVSWQDDRHGGADAVHVARISAAGGLTDPDGILVVSGNNRQTSPTVAENNTNWLVAWSDSRAFGSDIRSLRVRFNGTNQDAASREVSTAVGQQGAPDAARLGTGTIVAWNDARNGNDDIFAARVDAAGVVTDGAGIAISTAAREQITPEVASDGTSALIVWQDRRNGSFDILGAILGADGTVTAADIPICVSAGNQTRPSVAFDPTSGLYLVAWSSQVPPADADVLGARITPAGAVLDPCGVPISAGAGAQINPDVTFGGGRFFVTWEDRRNETLGDIFGARVTATDAGITVVDGGGIAIATATGSQTEPVAVFTQNSYLVAWTDGRDAGINSTDIYGGQVSTGGLASPNVVISNTTETESVPAMSSSQGGSSDVAVIAYTRLVPDLDTARVFHRRITSRPAGGTMCNSDAACDSGFCVDGRCCDTACGDGDPGDCQSCSAARGAPQDGTCAPVVANRVCRGYATAFCDRRERCDGTSIECPEDLGRREGIVCDAETGGVCPASDASGAPHVCALPTVAGP